MEFTYADNQISFLHNGESYSCSCLFCDESLKESDYGMEFLTSPYYRAEEDYFTVRAGTVNDNFPIGVIIPLQLLDEEDEEVIKEINSFYFRHASLAVRMVVEYLIKINALTSTELEFCLSDCFEASDIIVFLYKKQEVGSDISYIIPSLYDNGFYKLDKPLAKSERKYYESGYMMSEASDKRQRGIRNVMVKLLKHFGKQRYFYNLLYTELLPFVEDPFYRFISLYQAIELLSVYAYEEDVDRHIQRFKEKQISKNELREELIKAVKESKQIQLIYQGVKWKEDRDLLAKIGLLFDSASIDRPDSDDLCNYIYTLRNKIVHEMRSLYPHRDKLKDIVEYMDKNIFCLLAENGVKQ